RRFSIERGQHGGARIFRGRVDALLLHQHAADPVGVEQASTASRAAFQMRGGDHRQRRRQGTCGIAEQGGVVEMMSWFHREALMLPWSFENARRSEDFTEPSGICSSSEISLWLLLSR